MAEESKSSSEESVKLFVGQVPKHMTEPELLAMFKEFALVDEVNIIKDKATRASRGTLPYSISNLVFSDIMSVPAPLVSQLLPTLIFRFARRLLLPDLSVKGGGG